jgi:alpha-glucosidase (family GH31 glycosyl hydrolase)
MREFLQLRHRLVLYIYSAVSDNSRSSEPVIQPMHWGFLSLDIAYTVQNQYPFGPSLIVNPVVCPMDRRTSLAKAKDRVPPIRRIDILTGFLNDGDREINTYRSP